MSWDFHVGKNGLNPMGWGVGTFCLLRCFFFCFFFALYLVSLIQTASTLSPAITVFYSIKWVHDISDIKSPTDSKIVINVLEAAKRILAKPKNKKEPISVEILMSMYKRSYRFWHLKNQRNICACILGFAGFMHSSGILNIQVADIVFDQTFIESSKTDKHRNGSWIMI